MRCGWSTTCALLMLLPGGLRADNLLGAVVAPVYDRFVDTLSPCVHRDRHPGECGLPEIIDITDFPGTIDQVVSADLILDTVESGLGRAFDPTAVRGIRTRLTTALRNELPVEVAQAFERGAGPVRDAAERLREHLPGEEFARFKHAVLESTVVRLPNAVYGAILSGSAARHFAKVHCGPGCFNAHELKRGIEVTKVMVWQFKHREEIALSLRQLAQLGGDWQSALKIPDIGEWGALGRNVTAARARLADLEQRLDRVDRMLRQKIDLAESKLLEPLRDIESRLLDIQRDLLTPVREVATQIDHAVTTLRDDLKAQLPPWLHGVPKDWATFQSRMNLDLEKIMREKIGLSAKVSSSERVPALHPSLDNPFDPVLLHNGEFYHRVVDVVIPARGLPLRWERIYRSRHDFSGPLGRNWTHNYHERLLFEHDTPAQLTWFGADGIKQVFVRRDDGGWVSPRGVFVVLCERGVADAVCDGVFAADTATHYAILHPDGVATLFLADGRLHAHRDRFGNRALLHYDEAAHLIAIEDATGRQLHITNDRAGRIVSVSDWKGREWRYRYDARGDLVAVTKPATAEFPDGTTTRYEYSDGAFDSPLAHNLTAVIDPKGQRYLQNRYGVVGVERDRVIAQHYGDAPQPLRARYHQHRAGCFSGAAAVATTRVSDRRGIARLYDHNADGELLSERLVDDVGRVHLLAAYAYDPEGRRVRTTNPDGSSRVHAFRDDVADRREAGNITQVIRRGTAGGTRTYAMMYRDQSSDLHQIRDPLGRTVQMDYAGAVLVARHLADGRVERFGHDRFGQLTRQTHPDGTETQRTFTAYGSVASVTEDAIGLAATTHYQYDAVGNVTAITDPEGLTTRFAVNAHNLIVARDTWSVTSDSQRATRITSHAHFTHDANDNLVRTETQRDDGTRAAVEMTYDSLDHLTQRREQVDATRWIATHYAYDANDNLHTINWPEGNRTAMIHDAWNRPTAFGTGYRSDDNWRLRYDVGGRLSAWITPRGATHQFRYDEFGDLAEQIDPLGTTQRREYDAAGRVVRETMFDGHATPLADTRDHYDDADQLIARQRAWWRDDPAQASWITERWKYDARNRLTAMTDALGHAWHVQRDGLGRPTRIDNPAGHQLALQFDRRNRLVAATKSPPTASTRWDYDDRGRITAIHDPLDAITRYEYNTDAQITARIDPLGRRTEWDYDYLGRPTRHRMFSSAPPLPNPLPEGRGSVQKNSRPQNPLSLQGEGQGEGAPDGTRTTTFTWDGNHRLAALTDDHAQTTHFQYDHADHLTQVAYPDGTARSHTYDPDGQLHTTIDPKHTRMTHTYNPNGALVRTTARFADSTMMTQDFTYDPLGRLITAQEGAHQSAFAYDSLSHLIAERMDDHRVQQQVDAYGRVVSRAVTGGPQESRTYDPLGRLTAVTSGDFHARYQYDGWQSHTAVDFSTGTRLERTFDLTGHVLAQQYQRDGQTAWEENSAYDQSGLLASRRTTPQNHQWHYTYDGMQQLTNASLDTPIRAQHWDWTFDDLGRLCTRSPQSSARALGRGGPTRSVGGRRSFPAFVTARKTAGSGCTDAPRNPQTTTHFDPLDRLTHASSHEYQYDALRRRTREDNTSWLFTGWSELARYEKPVPGLERLLRRAAPRNDTVNDTLTHYFLRGSSPDELIAIADREGWHPVVQDQVQSIRAVDGVTLHAYDYTPYGRPLNEAPAPLAFAGRPYAADLQLSQFRHREYSPRSGQFLTRDPIEWQIPLRAAPFTAALWNPSTNHFRYAGNNPVNFTDPDGRQIIMERTKDTLNIRLTVEVIESPHMPENFEALLKRAADNWWAQPAKYTGPTVKMDVNVLPVEHRTDLSRHWIEMKSIRQSQSPLGVLAQVPYGLGTMKMVTDPKQFAKMDQADQAWVLAHEIGHWFGLPHPEAPETYNIMRCASTGCPVSGGDIEQIWRNYQNPVLMNQGILTKPNDKWSRYKG